MGERSNRDRRTLNSQFGYTHTVSKDTTKFFKRLKMANVFDPHCKKCVKMGQQQSCREVNLSLISSFKSLFSHALLTREIHRTTSPQGIVNRSNHHVPQNLLLGAKSVFVSASTSKLLL